MKENVITADELREFLHYNPVTGIFTWVKSARGRGGNKAQAGRIAGGISGGSGPDKYWSVGFKGKVYLAHRLAWLYQTGMWPGHIIDHKDGNKQNNKWNNLRPATKSQNSANQKINANNKSGSRGVHFHNKLQKWVAYITLNQKRRHLGVFKRKKSAISAYAAEAKKLFGEYARLS